MITLRIAPSKSIKIINSKFSLFWQDCETQEASAWPNVRSADKAGMNYTFGRHILLNIVDLQSQHVKAVAEMELANNMDVLINIPIFV